MRSLREPAAYNVRCGIWVVFDLLELASCSMAQAALPHLRCLRPAASAAAASSFRRVARAESLGGDGPKRIKAKRAHAVARGLCATCASASLVAAGFGHCMIINLWTGGASDRKVYNVLRGLEDLSGSCGA